MAFCYTKVFIEDKMLNKIHDLKKSRILLLEGSTFDDRFVLFYTVKKAVTTTIKRRELTSLL
jgi:hypothetical protein